MVNNKSGLIVNTLSAAGIRYLSNAAYGVYKVSLDRIVADCAVELKPHNIAIVFCGLDQSKQTNNEECIGESKF